MIQDTTSVIFEFDGHASKHWEVFPEARVIEFSMALNMQR